MSLRDKYASRGAGFWIEWARAVCFGLAGFFVVLVLVGAWEHRVLAMVTAAGAAVCFYLAGRRL